MNAPRKHRKRGGQNPVGNEDKNDAVRAALAARDDQEVRRLLDEEF